MINANDAELLAVRSSFCFTVARWRLGQSDLANLLGETTAVFGRGRVLPDTLDAAAETRIRLLVRLDQALSFLMPGDDVGRRLRDGTALGGILPRLAAFHDMRALRGALRTAEAIYEGGQGDWQPTAKVK